MGKSSSALDHESPPLGAYPRERLPSAADCKDRQIVVVDAGGARSVVFSDGAEWKPVGAPVASYTAAQLSAMAAAGGLTPYVTYVARDTGDTGTARSASVLSINAVAVRPKLACIGDSLTAAASFTAVPVSLVRAANILTINWTSHDLYAGARIRIDGLDTFDTSARGTYTVLSRVDANNITVSNPGPDGTLTLGTTCRVYNMQRRPNTGVITWMQILSNQTFDLVEPFACSGRRVADMLQFVSQAASTGAGYCWVLGGTNDVILDGASATTLLASLRTLHAAIRGAGMRPLICTIPPMVGTMWTAARAKTINQVNAGLRADCRADGRNILIDLYAAMVDPVNASAGTGKSGYFLTNDVHFTARGAYYAGKAAAAALVNARIATGADTRTASNADNYGFDTSSANILDAAPWTNSGGTVSAPVTGTMAAGLVAERGGTCAVVASIPARSDGFGYDATIVATPAAASDTANLRTASGTWQSRVVAGTAYTTSISVSASGLSGSSLRYLYSYIPGTVDGTAISYVSCALYPENTTAPDENWSGVLELPSFNITGTISGQNLFNALNFSAAGSAVTLAVGRMSIRGPVA